MPFFLEIAVICDFSYFSTIITQYWNWIEGQKSASPTYITYKEWNAWDLPSCDHIWPFSISHNNSNTDASTIEGKS